MRSITCAFLMIAAAAGSALADPPERVGRIAFVNGTASFRAADATEWSPAMLNYPVTIGDHVWTDRNGRVELEMGATAVALDATTAMSVLNLDSQIVQVRLVQGSAIVRVRERADDETIEIDTPNGVATVRAAG
ncbi:MAG TPA: FecR domain-containing protein, partial [Rhodanobacteraceae bacterium]